MRRAVVLLAAWARNAVLARRGNGDVLLAAAGNRVLAVYQVADRVRLTAVR